MAAAAVLSTLLALIAWGSALAAGLPVAALILGMAPGGIAGDGADGQGTGSRRAAGAGFHLTRTVPCNLPVGPLHRLGLRAGLP